MCTLEVESLAHPGSVCVGGAAGAGRKCLTLLGPCDSLEWLLAWRRRQKSRFRRKEESEAV